MRIKVDEDLPKAKTVTVVTPRNIRIRRAG